MRMDVSEVQGTLGEVASSCAASIVRVAVSQLASDKLNMNKSIQWFIWLGVSVLVIGLLYFFTRFETAMSEFATYEDAKKSGAIGESKWLPDWLPKTATNIREVHNIDTNQVWLEFRVDTASVLTAQGCEAVEKSRYRDRLPNLAESLAAKLGHEVSVLIGQEEAQLYICTNQIGAKWGVIFQPSSRSVWSWNAIAGV
jgi:hypothetical protein